MSSSTNNNNHAAAAGNNVAMLSALAAIPPENQASLLQLLNLMKTFPAAAADNNSTTTVSLASAANNTPRLNSAAAEIDPQFMLPKSGHLADSIGDLSVPSFPNNPSDSYNYYNNMPSNNNINNNVISPSKNTFSRANGSGKGRSAYHSVRSDSVPLTDDQMKYFDRNRNINNTNNNNNNNNNHNNNNSSRNNFLQNIPPQYPAEYQNVSLGVRNQIQNLKKNQEINRMDVLTRNDDIDVNNPDLLPFRIWFYQIKINPARIQVCMGGTSIRFSLHADSTLIDLADEIINYFSSWQGPNEKGNYLVNPVTGVPVGKWSFCMRSDKAAIENFVNLINSNIIPQQINSGGKITKKDKLNNSNNFPLMPLRDPINIPVEHDFQSYWQRLNFSLNPAVTNNSRHMSLLDLANLVIVRGMRQLAILLPELEIPQVSVLAVKLPIPPSAALNNYSISSSNNNHVNNFQNNNFNNSDHPDDMHNIASIGKSFADANNELHQGSISVLSSPVKIKNNISSDSNSDKNLIISSMELIADGAEFNNNIFTVAVNNSNTPTKNKRSDNNSCGSSAKKSKNIFNNSSNENQGEKVVDLTDCNKLAFNSEKGNILKNQPPSNKNNKNNKNNSASSSVNSTSSYGRPYSKSEPYTPPK